MTNFYDWSGGMESSAMLVVDRERIRETGAIVRWADTGHQFPEQYQSKQQIESILGIEIATVPRRITFDEYLFERGGMIRKGTNDCSRRMKRGNLSRHARGFPKPLEINLGYNSAEVERAEAFTDLNERDWCHWRFPLIEASVCRDETWIICRKAGFSILVGMYEKMGRFDCYDCGNQSHKQAMAVVQHYPDLAEKWMADEDRKGHSFMPVPLRVLVDNDRMQGSLFDGAKCACFGGTEDMFEECE